LRLQTFEQQSAFVVQVAPDGKHPASVVVVVLVVEVLVVELVEVEVEVVVLVVGLVVLVVELVVLEVEVVLVVGLVVLVVELVVVEVEVVVLVVELVVVEVEVVVVGAVVLVVDEDVVVVGAVVVVVVPGTLAGSAGFEPASSSVRSGKPSSSRSMPIRMPDPTGTAVYVSSCPAVFACARSWASVRTAPLVRSLWNDPAPPQPEPVQTQPRCKPERIPLTTTSHSPATARCSINVMRGPTVPPLVPVSVTSWPTIGARSESKPNMNCSTLRRHTFGEVVPQFAFVALAKPLLKTCALWKRKIASTLPSWRKPKPRTWSPMNVPDAGSVASPAALMAGATLGKPNLPIF
jgi:hypothetical protein